MQHHQPRQMQHHQPQHQPRQHQAQPQHYQLQYQYVPDIRSFVQHDVFMANRHRAKLWPRLQQPPSTHTVMEELPDGQYQMTCPHCDTISVIPKSQFIQNDSHVICADGYVPPLSTAVYAARVLRKRPYIKGCIRGADVVLVDGTYVCLPTDLERRQM